MLISEIADYLKAETHFLKQDEHIRKISPIQDAKKGEITFIANPDYAQYLSTTHASAVIIKEKRPEIDIPQLIHTNPYLAFAKVAKMFEEKHRGPTGVSDEAFIASNAELGENIAIFPFVFVCSNASVGDGCVLESGVSIGENVKIGKNCVIKSNVTIYHDCKIGDNCTIHAGAVIGSDGFGYAVGDGEIVKIPQTGNVVIGENVEVGANTTIDRAAMGSTTIGDNCKLDSQVQVAHNVKMGKNCMLSSFSGIAGSAVLGDWVVMGGSAGISNHINVCSGARIGAMSGVITDIKEPGDYAGYPAIPVMQWKRQHVTLKKIAKIEKRLRDLEKKDEPQT